MRAIITVENDKQQVIDLKGNGATHTAATRMNARGGYRRRVRGNQRAPQQRYEGLSKQLLQETALQRQALQQEQGRVASQLKFAERRIATLEEAVAHADSEAAAERDKRQAAVGEANALKAVNASQHAQLDELMRAAIAKTPAPKQRAAPAAKSAAKRAAPRRKGG